MVGHLVTADEPGVNVNRQPSVYATAIYNRGFRPLANTLATITFDMPLRTAFVTTAAHIAPSIRQAPSIIDERQPSGDLPPTTPPKKEGSTDSSKKAKLAAQCHCVGSLTCPSPSGWYWLVVGREFANADCMRALRLLPLLLACQSRRFEYIFRFLSVRVGPNIAVFFLIILHQGEAEILSLTDNVLPKRLGPKSAPKIYAWPRRTTAGIPRSTASSPRCTSSAAASGSKRKKQGSKDFSKKAKLAAIKAPHNAAA
ncbi:hypothetical protein H0H81_002019 [Sphagnurus paluster]|uniref:Uncharacterized protein n=1 Tax=Sphagnurus paluster TaxID=117069 RepID=A0A9P7FSP9_9AGAR|nr:hypothetical protein H0H81_002019 [Sphagnurus paluster]